MKKQTSDMKLSLIVIGAIACLFLFKLLSPFMNEAVTPATPTTERTPPAAPIQKITRSDAEWRKLLSAEQYMVMRQDDTEAAYSGVYVNFNGKGTYLCAGCNLPLFSSDDKFDAKTGWTCFTKPILPENILHKKEGLWGAQKVGAYCARCDSHIGEVLNNGTPPSGKLYSVNSVALKFLRATPQKQ